MDKGLKNEGFTLVEVLAALGLFGLVMVGLMSVFWFSFYGFQNETSRSELQYSVRQARSRILDDFRQCNAFAVNDDHGNNVAGDKQGTRLHLVYEDEEVDFYISNHQLYRNSSLPDTPAQPVASNISSVTFLSPVAGILEINITADIGGHELRTGTISTNRVD